MKTLQPRVRTLDTRLVKPATGTKRKRGNSRMAIIKGFARENYRLCAACQKAGLISYGDELDHIIPLWQGGAESDSNRQWLCKAHHKAKTAEEAALRAKGGNFCML